MVRPALFSEFHRLRLSYDLYGFVKLTNALESWQVDSLEAGFDRIYVSQTGRHPNQSTDRLPPLSIGVESDFEYMKTFATATPVIDAVKAVAGVGCQFLAADILCVYDDSIGAHRDLIYDFDTPKALVFLSDCNDGTITVPESYQWRNFSGSFAVLSGSHLPGSLYNSLSSQLSDWPDPSESSRLDLTPHFLRGDRKPTGDVFYPCLDYDSRYQGFSLIPFKRGDVVIFSTRALHALLPTYSQHFAKLAAFVFIEDYQKVTGVPFGIRKTIDELSDQEFRYASLPYNIRLNDLLVKGADFDVSLAEIDEAPLGLVELLTKPDSICAEVFHPLTQIYRICDAEIDKFTQRRKYSSREKVMFDFMRIVNQQREDLRKYDLALNPEDIEVPPPPSEKFETEVGLFRDQCLACSCETPAPPSPVEAPAGFPLKRIIKRFVGFD